MVETFSPSVGPSDESTVTPNTRVQALQMGDGYTVRQPDGINNTSDEWNLVWPALDSSGVVEVYDWLRARQGVTAFLYTAPGEASAKLWTAHGLSKRPVGPTQWRVSVSLRQEFDPGVAP